MPDLLSPAGLEQPDKLPQTRLNLAAALVAGTIAFGAGQASAMPAFDHAVTKATQAAQPEQVRWGLRGLGDTFGGPIISTLHWRSTARGLTGVLVRTGAFIVRGTDITGGFIGPGTTGGAENY